MTIKVLFALLNFLLVAQAQALSPVVRVDLSHCQLQGASQFSGLLIHHGAKTYVVTSSWAQMSAATPGPRCEKVWSENGEVRITPIATDHVAGLALYEVLDGIGVLPSPSPEPENEAASIWILQGQGPRARDGAIVINGSRRHQLPRWDRVLEWQGVAVSPEVIGAGVWKNKKWLGLVSHQYLELVPGAKTKIHRWDLAAARPQNHLVLISSADIEAWMQTQLAHPQEPVLWAAEDQRRGVDRWSVGDLLVTAKCPEAADPNPGGQYPIGGNDGVGIGGDSIENKACRMSVSRSQTPSPWLPKSLQSWQAEAATDLLALIKIDFWYALGRDAKGPLRDYFFSVESFVKLALDDHKKYLDIRAKAPPVELQELNAKALKLQQDSLHCYQVLFIREANVQELVRKLFFVSLLSQSPAWRHLSSDDMKNVMDAKGDFAEGWKMLSWIGACDTPQLRASAEDFAREHHKVWAP